LLAIFFMAMLQLYPDSLPDYPAACQTLDDLGFSVIPQITAGWSVLADVMVLVTIALFLLITPFLLETPQLVVRRWFLLLGSLYLFRGLTVILTRYPRLPYALDKYQPGNPIVGALSIMIGAKSTATDIMFSGHTVNFTLAASFVSRYTWYGMFSFVFWVYNVLGMLALIATREHYTSDVAVAFIITKLAFWAYHLFFDSLYKRFWVPGLELRDTGDVHLMLPAELVDAAGERVPIEKYMIPDKQIFTGTERRSGRAVEVVRFDPADSMRYEIFKYIRWLDGE
jgi:hypothetical protein